MNMHGISTSESTRKRNIFIFSCACPYLLARFSNVNTRAISTTTLCCHCPLCGLLFSCAHLHVRAHPSFSHVLVLCAYLTCVNQASGHVSRHNKHVYNSPGLSNGRLDRTKYDMISQDCGTVLKHDSKHYNLSSSWTQQSQASYTCHKHWKKFFCVGEYADCSNEGS